ncbi:unnamed protein product [Rhizoctonia solani]|nr:unnamed protein product [Rhizoctonia solani]
MAGRDRDRGKQHRLAAATGYKGEAHREGSPEREPDPRGLNILCLDGGGVRGLSELLLISEVMNRLGRGSNTPKPTDRFDIIAGSGTGGVIACMLGRLRMSNEAAVAEYGKLVQAAFCERRSIGSTGGAYVGSNLRKALKAMVKVATGNEDEKMRDGREDGCKTMIFAMSRHNMNSSIPIMFRSYLASSNPGPECTIWEALYATMAHPDLFDSIDIGDYPLRQSFIGGEIGNSNPIAHVLSEVRTIYLERYVSCVLSIGAGHPGTIHIPNSQISRVFRTKELAAMKHMATDSERVAEDMARRFEDVRGVYFRLSVDQGMQNVDTDDWEKLGDVIAHTHAYLSKFDVGRIMSLVVQAIEDRKLTVAVAWIATSVFTGWDDEIEGAGLCVAGDSDERRVCVLYGLGGAGKSQLAFKTVEKNRNYWAWVIYINATSKEAIEDTLRDLAIKKGIADLVLYAKGPCSTIQVSTMAPEQALLLLSKMIGLRGRTLSANDIDAAVGLLENFGHLALAIVQAGAYISHHPHITISKYHELFLNGRQQILEQYSRLPVRVDDYDKTVYTTWMLSYDLLERRTSQQLLWLIAFLYPEGITAEIFQRSSPSMQSFHPVIPLSDLEHVAENYMKNYLGQFQSHEGYWDAITFSDVISELASYSLIEFDRTNLSYNIHVLVQDWVRSVVLEQVEAPDNWLEHTTTLLSRSVGWRDTGSKSIGFKRALGPHVSKILVEHGDFVGVNHATYFADVFKAREEWDKEERLRIRVKKGLEEHQLDPEHQDILKNADDLVTVYRNQGRWSEAESLCSYVWETRKRIAGEHHIETFTSAVSLIEILQKQSRLESARELHKEVEEKYLEWLIHPYIAALAMGNLSSDPGLELNRRGGLALRLLQVAQCIDHSQEALVDTMLVYNSILQEQLPQATRPGQTHIDITILKLTEGVATLGVLTGRFDLAKAHYEGLLHAQKLVLGGGHKDTQKTMQNLADVYLVLNEWEKANEIQRWIFDVYKRSLKKSDRGIILMKTVPCIILTYIIRGKWYRAVLFAQAVRAISIVFSEGTFEEQIQELVNYLARGLADESRAAYIRPFQDALLTPEGQTPLSQDVGRKKKVIGMVREKVVGLGEGSDRGAYDVYLAPTHNSGNGDISEIEGLFNLLNSHLVTLFTETSELEPHVSALVTTVIGAPETHTGIKYRVLSNLFNTLPRSSPLRQNVYRALLGMASDQGELDVLQIDRTDVNRWLSEWDISEEDKSAFLDTVAEAFRKAGNVETAYGYQLAYLRSVPASSPKALEASTRVISSAVSEPSIFELDTLLRVDTLQAAKDHPLFALLRVFTSGDLAQYHEWEASHESTLSEFGK